MDLGNGGLMVSRWSSAIYVCLGLVDIIDHEVIPYSFEICDWLLDMFSVYIKEKL